MSTTADKIEKIKSRKRVTATNYKGLSFWCDSPNGKDGDRCCFWHQIGQPLKEGVSGQLWDYEQEVIQSCETSKQVWIKKATGLGITELFLRYIAYLCLKDSHYKNSQICIVTGPRLDLAVTLISRIKKLFPLISFDSKETVVNLNDCRIEAFPSHHLDTMRGLPHVKLILLDEADFFNPGEQENALAVSQRYLAKGLEHLVLVSTPNVPGGLFEKIEKDKNSQFNRIFLDYTKGVGKIYTDAEIEEARKSRSFEREFNLKYGYGIGNIFPYELVESITTNYDLSLRDGIRALGVDPAFGSTDKASKFAIVGIEKIEGICYVKEARQYSRASPTAMVELVSELARNYDVVLVDASQQGTITDLRHKDVNVIEISFNKDLQKMTFHSSDLVKTDRVRIHPSFSELLAQLKAVEANEKGNPDKKKLNFDLGDAFMLACYYFKSSGGYGVVVTPGDLADNIPQRPEETQVIRRVIELSVSPSGHKRSKIPLQLEDD
ncbi:MAG: hypothetical protein KGI25_03740 [Thaumarchaeota archaeon]|nr:hypothetical protein [Nitrososphaerota archaeon]